MEATDSGDVEETVDAGYGRTVSRRTSTFGIGGYGGSISLTKSGQEKANNILQDEKGKGGNKEIKDNAAIDKVNQERAKKIAEKERSEQDNNYNFFYKTSDALERWGAEYINDNGADDETIVINAHGSANGIATPEKSFMGAKDLHDYLYKNNELYKKSLDKGVHITVRIEACNTGNGMAEKFSKYNSNMTVIAPTAKITCVAGIYGYFAGGKGTYATFENGKKIE